MEAGRAGSFGLGGIRSLLLSLSSVRAEDAELARELACTKHKLTYRLVFFGGEEALAQWSATDSLYRSRHFAERLREKGADRIKAVIIVDMIGDARLDIQRETYSTRWLTDLVFTQAGRPGYGRYFLNNGRGRFFGHGFPRWMSSLLVVRDSGPLNLYWHTHSDTVDRCRAASLAIVGDTVLKTLEALASKAVSPR